MNCEARRLLFAFVGIAFPAACEDPRSEPPPMVVSGGVRDARATSGTKAEDFVLPKPPTEPFVSNEDFPDCVHPGVQATCEDGWCRVPPGCFIWGSPEWEPDRGANVEHQGPVTITRAFEIMQHEVTVAEWEELGFEAVFSPTYSCQESRCPATKTSWFLAAQYANAASAAHDPPLEPCYVLEGCEFDRGAYGCDVLGMNAPTAYECEGYRLPTRAEWQYAARAGTTTTYYSGDITVTEEEQDVADGCLQLIDPNLDPIAWYCGNSGDGVDIASRRSRPVGMKLPNAWGLYDVLGNAAEWVHDAYTGFSPEYPAADPFGEIGIKESSRTYVGGKATNYPALLRVGKGLDMSAFNPMDGLRLARTLPE